MGGLVGAFRRSRVGGAVRNFGRANRSAGGLRGFAGRVASRVAGS